MTQLTWNPTFSVNHAEIDEQHQQWFEIYNKMHEALLEPDLRAQTKIIEEALSKIMDYTECHFRFEEEYMRTIGYPDIASHIRMHKDFDSLIYSYYRNSIEGQPFLNTRLLKTIREWLFEHMLVEDRKFCQFAHGIGTDHKAGTASQAVV